MTCGLLAYQKSHRNAVLKPLHDPPQIIRQPFQTLRSQSVRHAVKPFRDTAGDGGQRVTVTAQRYSGSDDVLKILSLQKGGDGLGDGFLTTFHMAVDGPNLIAGTVQVVYLRSS